MDEHLFNPEGRALSVLAATPYQVCNSMLARIPAHPEWDILRVRGEKATDDARFFDELAAALQFPYYFGENWDAANECVSEPLWLKGSSFLFIFDSAQHLLSESDRGFRILLEVLADAHDRWHRETADFGPRGRQPIAFQSILACAPDAVDALIERMDAANATFVRL
jgi:hypothetical protein